MVKASAASGVSYYRWRKEYGGMDVSQAKRTEELEQESATGRELTPTLLDVATALLPQRPVPCEE